MCGIVLKRLGHNVHILEQYPSSDREGLAAGVGSLEHVQAFFQKHDLLVQRPSSILAEKAQVLNPDMSVKRTIPLSFLMSTWDTIYYRLRANFDGMVSTYCHAPPPLAASDGKAVFDFGKRVTNVRYVEGQPLVEVEEVGIDAGFTTMHADLVIAADGSSSRMREIVQPGLQREYPGYVAWRGTVPTRDVPAELVKILESRTTFYLMPRNYIFMYHH